MSDQAPPTSDPLPTGVDALCDGFEAAWQAGEQPRIEDCLAQAPAVHHARLVRELLSLELHYRIRAGERPTTEELHARFPAFPAAVAAALSEAESVATVYTDRHLRPAGQPELPQQLGRYRILEKLGEGGFGIVYRGHDDQLHRDVAVKVPHNSRIVSEADAEQYLAEAQNLAGLDHSGIVPVYDVGRTEDGHVFVVSKFVAGSDLARRLQQGRPTCCETVEIIARAAEALHHAHRRGLVHRDVKPANILLDAEGRPVVADFGLALRDADFGSGPGFAGTPSYMSPEQARREGHRVDARTDVYSLGVVLYEMLTGRRPFQTDNLSELLQLITSQEAKPPRQHDDHIPQELDRICLKALNKRASDRYSTAADFAADLRHWQTAQAVPLSPVTLPPPAAKAADVPAALTEPLAGPVRIVPRGLGSYEAADADFFLELLPGARDRQGLPDSVRFWKTRIEETEPDNTFAVGLLYGPSGCGKSSLVKAGLLPRLAAQVEVVYVEATPEDTETRLVRGLAKRCPHLSAGASLVEMVVALRRGQGLPAGRKVLLVLDQFEQWLHAHRQEESGILIEALRQCDGGRVQALVLVRDDFWMPVSRFMTALEVDLVQGKNTTAVDLFAPAHARKVLAAFGRAFGTLPEGPLSAEQEQFLDQVVAGLAEDGKVVSVRLAVFAETVKGKTWVPATLKAIGGATGAGAAYLEEMFGSTASPAHRMHDKAARAVLQALLPEQGSDIKGHMRCREELQQACGYGERPREWAQLLGILDGELRLLTPTDPEGQATEDTTNLGRIGNPSYTAAEDTTNVGRIGNPSYTAAEDTTNVGWISNPSYTPTGQYYQLTHDYLVPSLREWLTRKQRETRRGRAELRLAERATMWGLKREDRHLPAWWEWLNIRLFTRKKDWSTTQRAMMRRSARRLSFSASLLAAGLVALVAVFLEAHGRLRAQALLDNLLRGRTEDVPAVVHDMAGYRRWLDTPLRQARDDSDPHKRLHASLALLPVDDSQMDYLHERLLTASPEEVLAIRQVLLPGRAGAREQLWAVLEDTKRPRSQRFRAAAALAADETEDRWQKVCPDIAAELGVQDVAEVGRWGEVLRPVRGPLLQPLAEVLLLEGRNAAERRTLTRVYAIYAKDQPEAVVVLEKVLEEKVDPAAAVPMEAKLKLARRQANAATLLAALGQWRKVLPLLRHGVEPTVRQPDPTVRSYLIDRLAEGGVEVAELRRQLGQAQVSERRAMVLALGELDPARLPPTEVDLLVARLVELYRDDPDTGIHGAAGWLLRQWKREAKVKEMDAALLKGKVDGKRQWYVNGQGQTMAIIPGPGVFRMGEGEEQHQRRIDRGFAIAAREVTIEEFRKFRKEHRPDKDWAPRDDCPVVKISWYDTAAYCRWLSEKEGIDKDEMCYPRIEDIEAAEKNKKPLKMPKDYLHKQGYRLPTEAEWEYACRAGSETTWFHGEAEELLPKYAWYSLNSDHESHPVGLRRPNDLGLFDMHGNAWEWCQDGRGLWPKRGEVIEDKENISDISYTIDRLLRGGSFGEAATGARSAYRTYAAPWYRFDATAFRPARTFP